MKVKSYDTNVRMLMSLVQEAIINGKSFAIQQITGFHVFCFNYVYLRNVAFQIIY